MFKYDGENAYVDLATARANEVIRSDKFLTSVSANSYDMSLRSGKYIANLIRFNLAKNTNPISVITYKPRWRWSKSLGYFNPNKPNNIYLNTYRLNRTTGSISGTLVHELIHWLDSKENKASFGHGNNNSKGKENTAPYYIGNLALSIVDDKYADFDNLENSEVATYIPWYKRIFSWIFL